MQFVQGYIPVTTREHVSVSQAMLTTAQQGAAVPVCILCLDEPFSHTWVTPDLAHSFMSPITNAYRPCPHRNICAYSTYIIDNECHVTLHLFHSCNQFSYLPVYAVFVLSFSLYFIVLCMLYSYCLSACTLSSSVCCTRIVFQSVLYRPLYAVFVLSFSLYFIVRVSQCRRRRCVRV